MILIFFSGLLIGYLICHLTNHFSTTYTETRNPGSYKFINPLLECNLADFSQDKNLDQTRNQIAELIRTQIQKNNITFASVYFRNLNNGPWFGINEKELFSPASLIKIPIMITYYHLSETDPQLLNQTLIFDPTKLSSLSQNIIPQITLTPQTSYTIEELIKRMVIYSDNAAYDILRDHLDSRQIIKTFQDLGVDISLSPTSSTDNIISVKSFASFFRILFNASYLSPTVSEKALELLSHTQYRDGLVAGVPANVIVSHKFGERNYEQTGEKQLHDCGIVYFPNKPYLLCVMTRGHDFSHLSTTIKDISATVYQAMSTNQ